MADLARVPTLEGVDLVGIGAVTAPLGGSAALEILIRNVGLSDEAYRILLNDPSGWLDLSLIPSQIDLAAGEHVTVSIPIHIPPDVAEGTVARATVRIESFNNPYMHDSQIVDVTASASAPPGGGSGGGSGGGGNPGGGSPGGDPGPTPDTIPPVLALPQPLVVDAAGPDGSVVNFMATAVDAVDGDRPVVCTPPAGALFVVGTTTVSCSATDLAGNVAAGSFTVTVRDSIAPTTRALLSPQPNAYGWHNTAVTYSASASDTVDGTVPVTCSPGSGSTFPIGITSVECSATDVHGNRRQSSFTVTVVDTTAPAITVPADITTPATSFAGAAVVFAMSAVDLVDGARPVVCSPPSESVFAIGTTTVSCSAGDTRGNPATRTFTVTVTFTPRQAGALLQTLVTAIRSDDIPSACNQLTGAIALIQTRFPARDAAALIRVATEAQRRLGCP